VKIVIEENLFKLVDWFQLSRSSNGIYMIDVTTDHVQSREFSHRFDKEALLGADEFVTYSIHEMNRIGSLTTYEIVKKVVDEKGNLIVFAKPEFHQVEKD